MQEFLEKNGKNCKFCRFGRQMADFGSVLHLARGLWKKSGNTQGVEKQIGEPRTSTRRTERKESENREQATEELSAKNRRTENKQQKN